MPINAEQTSSALQEYNSILLHMSHSKRWLCNVRHVKHIINCTVLNVKIPCILDFIKSTNCIQLYNLLKCNKSITDRGGFMRGRGGGRNNTLNYNIFKWLITAKIIWQCIVNIMKQNYGVILQVTNNSNKCVTVETKLCQIKCHFDCVMKSMKLNTLYSYFGNAL